MCSLTVNGTGPEPGHCHECDQLIAAAYRPPPYSGRGIDAYGLSDYTIDALDDDDLAA